MSSIPTRDPEGSAQILQFPARGRFAVAQGREGVLSIDKAATLRVPNVAVGSGWYHDEAIREERTRGN